MSNDTSGLNDFTLAAIQLDTIAGQVMHNVHKALHWTRNAFRQGARYVFLHEGLTADYTPDPLNHARSLESAEVQGFAHLAREANGYVALGLNELWQGQPFLSIVWLGPQGVCGVYRKSYLWPNDSQTDGLPFDQWLKTYIPQQRGYRLERSILGRGDGTVVLPIGNLRIGCLICADGSQDAAWQTFYRDHPDLIFWQNNRTTVTQRNTALDHARALKTPIVVTNRCGFSWHYFTHGGSHFINPAGNIIAQANDEGREEMITTNWSLLSASPL